MNTPSQDPATPSPVRANPADILAQLTAVRRPRPEQDTPYAAPETPIQKTVAACWEEVLSIEAVGLHDNFFNLDGDSLQMTQIAARVREHLGVELSFQDFFDSPTVAGIAQWIEQNPSASSQPVDRN